MQDRLITDARSNPSSKRADGNHFAAPRRLAAADGERRDEVAGSILALAAVALLAIAISTGSHSAPEQHARLLQMGPTFVAP